MPNHLVDCFGISVNATNSNILVLGEVLTAKKDFVCVCMGILDWDVAKEKLGVWKYF